MENEFKRCSKCGATKSRGDFYIDRAKPDGLRPVCKICDNAIRHARKGATPRPSAEERFWASVEVGDGCWLWKGQIDEQGYGRFPLGKGSHRSAHRFSYELLIGPISEGLTIDHLCRNRACVRPDHLEPVSMAVNVLRGETFVARNVAKTHCPRGHPYDEANTEWYRGRRYCRTCRRGGRRKALIAPDA